MQKVQYPHVPAAFINSLSEEGTREEILRYLQEQWNETCALREQLEKARRAASDKSDFWFQQSDKSSDRREHYEVIGSQFRTIAQLCAFTDEEGK